MRIFSLFDRSTVAGPWRLRTSLVVLMLLVTVVTFSVIGVTVLAYRLPGILAEERQVMRVQASTLADHFELSLAAIEGRLGAIAAVSGSLPPETLGRLLDAALGEGGLQAVYLLNERGVVDHVAVPDALAPARDNLVGADLSRNPLFLSARQLVRREWSDRYLSPLTGAAAVGLSIPAGGQVILAELSPEFAAAIIGVAVINRANPLLVVDRGGEHVAGRNLAESDVLRNWTGDLGGSAERVDGDMLRLRFSGAEHDTAVARSPRLGWTFLAASPAALANPRVRVTVGVVLSGFLGSLVLSLLLAPLWAARMSAPLQSLMARTRSLASGDFSGAFARGPIHEFNELAGDMESMAKAVEQRQGELEHSEERLMQTLQRVQQLNLELEERVERRTAALARANQELSEAMATLQLTQTELTRAEMLASLGNLVGGVAHELNTPIGNGVMAITTLHDQIKAFRREMEEGLRRSTLNEFVDRLEDGTEIVVRNLQRANDLIASFKQVAVDQTSVQRRRFRLAALVHEILVTLNPTIRRTPFRVDVDVPEELVLDSYPGPLGQVLTNLLTNAIGHGLEGRSQGTIRIAARLLDEARLLLEVVDDGAGIPPELRERIFDPFVTTKLGRGGTGLGLHIVWNTVTVVLGGSIAVDSDPGQGTAFRIVLPLTAPQQGMAG
jgi:signal transduction histidine kinase